MTASWGKSKSANDSSGERQQPLEPVVSYLIRDLLYTVVSQIFGILLFSVLSLRPFHT